MMSSVQGMSGNTACRRQIPDQAHAIPGLPYHLVTMRVDLAKASTDADFGGGLKQVGRGIGEPDTRRILRHAKRARRPCRHAAGSGPLASSGVLGRGTGTVGGVRPGLAHCWMKATSIMGSSMSMCSTLPRRRRQGAHPPHLSP